MDQYMIIINKSFLLLYFFNGLIKKKKGVLAWLKSSGLSMKVTMMFVFLNRQYSTKDFGSFCVEKAKVRTTKASGKFVISV
jgi:hypothetical protein